MKVTVKEEQPVRKFKDLQVGDVFRIFVTSVLSTSNRTYMKTNYYGYQDPPVNLVCLDDGTLGCEDPERPVVIYHLKVVPE